MRGILFRGKRIDNGKWIYGDLIHAAENCMICGKHGNLYVDPETVSEFTGLYNKNSKRVFEGDIVRILYTDWLSKSEDDPRTLDEYLRDIEKTGTIIWDSQNCCFCVRIENCKNPINCGLYGYIEVIGNKWDNPELLESKNE